MGTNRACPQCNKEGIEPKVIPQLQENYKDVLVCDNPLCDYYQEPYSTNDNN